MNINTEPEVNAAASVERKRELDLKTTPKGHYSFEHWRNGECIGKYELDNMVTNEGKNHYLDITFGAGTQVTTWYIGLINTGATLAAGDTMASHAGWTEFTSYSEANRQTWDDAAASSGSKTSATQATFTASGSGTVYGAFLVSNNTKGGTTGTLMGTAAFASGIPVIASDVLKVTFTATQA